MPVDFPSLDPEGRPVKVTYYAVDEIAPKLHVGRMTVRDRCRRNVWPHLRVGGRYFMSDEQLAEVVEMQTVRPNLEIPDFRIPGVIGLVADPDEAEAEEGVR